MTCCRNYFTEGYRRDSRHGNSGGDVPIGTARRPRCRDACRPDETAVGSVSGSCVEGAFYDLAQEVVASGEPILQRYGVSDDDDFAVGLTCGGIIEVFLEKVSRESFPELGDTAQDIEAGRPVFGHAWLPPDR